MIGWLRRRRRFRASDSRWRRLDAEIAAARPPSVAPGLGASVQARGHDWWTAPPDGGERVAAPIDRTEIFRRTN